MSTLASARFGDTDEEDELDGEYKPVETSNKRKKPSKSKVSKAKRTADGEEDSASATDSGSSDEDEGSDGERDEFRDERNQLQIEAAAAEAQARAERAKNLLADMQSELAGGVIAEGSSKAATSVEENAKEAEEMVEIKRPRKYAGEVIYETVKVPRSDPQAISYLSSLSQPPSATTTSTSAPVASSSAPPAPPKAIVKGGPPRKKPRQSLEAMAAGLGKAKKMTTLEKTWQLGYDSIEEGAQKSQADPMEEDPESLGNRLWAGLTRIGEWQEAVEKRKEAFELAKKERGERQRQANRKHKDILAFYWYARGEMRENLDRNCPPNWNSSRELAWGKDQPRPAQELTVMITPPTPSFAPAMTPPSSGPSRSSGSLRPPRSSGKKAGKSRTKRPTPGPAAVPAVADPGPSVPVVAAPVPAPAEASAGPFAIWLYDIN